MPESAAAIVKELRPLGSKGYCDVMKRHGIREPIFGVKISELKKIQKRVKKNHELALALYDTGIYDAMYLAGLIADETRMTKKDLQHWMDQAYCTALGCNTVAWVTAESRYGFELALKWIESKKPTVAAAGWSVLSCLVALKQDDDLEIGTYRKLVKRAQDTLQDQDDDVKYSMNNFVISVGGYVQALTSEAVTAAKAIGVVHVDMGDTECKVPDAAGYIKKMTARGIKKRKTVRC